MRQVDSGLLLAQLLQAIDQTTEAPCPLAIGSVVLEVRIQTVEIVFAALMMLTPLGIIIDLRFMERHGGDTFLLNQLHRQGNHAGAYHQRIRGMTGFWIMDGGCEQQVLTIHSHLHLKCVARHHGLDVLGSN